MPRKPTLKSIAEIVDVWSEARRFFDVLSHEDQTKILAFFHLLNPHQAVDVDLEIMPDQQLRLTFRSRA